MHPTRDQSHLPEEDKIRFPMSLVCHCNDCRSSSGALVNYAFACLNEYVSFKFETREGNQLQQDWMPAANIFPPMSLEERKETWLQFYKSSEKITRSFCGRCGTNLTYCYWPMPSPWPRFLDIWAGTIDKEDLEREGDDGAWLKPVRHCWIDVEVPWIGKLACEGSGGIPKHAGGSDFK